MAWFRRHNEGIITPTEEKLEVPDGVWFKCPSCDKTIPSSELADNLYVCTQCGHHTRINSAQYFPMLFENGEFTPLFENIRPLDKLTFVDTKAYADRLVEAETKIPQSEALSVAAGNVMGCPTVICCMNFNYIGGSMGSVVGERIARGIDYCIKEKHALVIITKSGGARMQESAFSLMQMAKTSAKLTQLSAAGLPYVCVLTDPTTGGVTASFAMLGDLNIAEPGALIGFAGPRVIKETIKKDLPKGFQRSEFLIEKGFLDMIVARKELKQTLGKMLCMLTQKAKAKMAS